MDRLLRPVRQRGAAFSRTTPPLGKYCFSAVKAVTAVQRTEILGFGTGETGLSRTRPLHHRRGRWPPWDMTPLWENLCCSGDPTPDRRLPYFSDTWLWDGTTRAPLYTPGGVHPPERYGFGMAYDPSQGVLIYGGLDISDSVTLNDMWSLTP